MDVTINSTSFHLPAEIVDLIAAQLSGDLESIKNLRLVNKLFSRSATPHICDFRASPSELFTLPDGVEEYSDSAWPPTREQRKPVGKGITTWTWMQVPESIPLEDMSTPVGVEWRRLLWAPVEFDPEGSDHNRRHTKDRDGRLALCWGRLIDCPRSICILHQWPSVATWDAYRSSVFARNLREFLDRAAPGCIETSRSETMTLNRGARSNVNCLFDGYHEFRTIHFPPTISDQQRQGFEKVLKPPIQVKILGDSRPLPPNYVVGAKWCWLPGLRNFQGQMTVAMRFVFPWRSPQIKEAHQKTIAQIVKNGEERNLYMRWQLVEISPIQLQKAQVVGIESFHSELETGPFH